jgi:hypothetical protein
VSACSQDFHIYFGALTKPLVAQLREQDIQRPPGTKNGLHHLQQDADAITRLAIRGYFGDAAKKTMQKKLLTKLTDLLQQSAAR